ncbi:MAG: chorismate synthase [Bacillota bacterium]|jgi:chorismate synthase
MSVFWGNHLKIALFGESHGPAVGVTISGLPCGLAVKEEEIALAMARRAPGQDQLSTPRKEKDAVKILSGLYQGKTTGTPLCAMIENTDTKSHDYDTGSLLRPGHADYTGAIRYDGCNDPAGGGHFSGRLTAPLVFAGVLADKWLQQRNIVVAAHIASIAEINDDLFDPCLIEAAALTELKKKPFAVLNDERGNEMRAAILASKAQKDSLGGIIECAACNLPVGWGDPMFYGVESVIASMIFAIPAIKGVEFGAGFAIGKMPGSLANDPFAIKDGHIITTSNHNGGINGGITNGMPLLLRVAVKPTPSIGKKQKTVDLNKKCETEISIVGRHDPCIVPRVIAVIEAAVQLALLDIGLERG